MDLSSIFRFSDMLEYFPKILSRSYCSGKRCRGAGPGIYSGCGTYL